MAWALPLAWLESVAFAQGATNEWQSHLARGLIIVVVLGMIRLIPPIRIGVDGWHISRRLTLFSIVTAVLWLGYGVTENTALAWLAQSAWLTWLTVIGASVLVSRWQSHWLRVMVFVSVCIVGGIVPIAIAQMQSRFADEEFFAGAQAVVLAVLISLLIVSTTGLHLSPVIDAVLRVRARWLFSTCVVALSIGAFIVLVSYQASFYSFDPPTFPRITPQSPAVCGESAPASQVYDGAEVFRRMITRVAMNPEKTAAELGMLALAENDRQRAIEFRQALLAEAQTARFTTPSNSVKWNQWEGALRVYYYPKVRERFPDVFSATDEQMVRVWFAAINRRALTVEWVDALYALAYRMWPQGPYENQEIGAGLLALLEKNQLSDPALSATNRAYLQNNPRGWAQRFHNTDDAYFYQAHWLNNALFQATYAPAQVVTENQRLSFAYLLQLATPDGSPVIYNLPKQPPLTGAYYWGALLLRDPRLLWLAARSLADTEARQEFLSAQVGAEMTTTLRGISPNTGSCLLYADSGLPTQVGPLAPDKIVMRDGWELSSRYVLLNLRFTGWHRYKATNALIALNQAGPLVFEHVEPTPIGWLPEGRSTLRDKRVPRERLNGLLVPAVGLNHVWAMLGLGDVWAQDPPHYARVTAFEPQAATQKAQTVIEAWHGWTHVRTIYLDTRGPIVVVDSARGGEGHAALSWHVVGDGEREGDGLWLRRGQHPARLVLSSWVDSLVQPIHTTYGNGQSIVKYATHVGQLDVVSVFLTDEWATATVSYEKLPPHSIKITIRAKSQSIDIIHEATWAEIDL
jgi:hypothetical protein